MRWDYGSVYKAIRKSKRLTQEAICGETIDRTTLVKFEQNKSTPRYETMSFLVRQLDMNLDEFEYICNLYRQDNGQALLNDIDELLGTVSFAMIKQVIHRCEDYLKYNPRHVPIRRRLSMLQVVYQIREEGLSKPRKAAILAESIWHEMKSYDTWYKNDFRLISSILFYFPIEQLPELANLILERLVKYDHFKEIQGTKLSLLGNLAYLFMRYDNVNEALRFSTLLEQEAKLRKRYDYLTRAVLYQGIVGKDNPLIRKALRMADDTDDESTKEHCLNLIKQFNISLL
ncbi:helix-turn-helix domain-containing protein [Streptococcus rifensis]